MFEKDPIEILLLKILLVFFTAIMGIYLLVPSLSVFDVMPKSGNILADTFMFIIVPLAAVFILIYKIFRIFSA